MNQAGLAALVAAVIGAVLFKRYPFPGADPLLQLVLAFKPYVWHMFRWSWTVMLFTTSWIGCSALLSLLFIFTTGQKKKLAGKLPPFPISDGPVQVVMGELHHERRWGAAEVPRWLTIPDRGLFTGMAIFGAVGTGKTSCCMRPYAKQILQYRADDPVRKIGGIVLEVKGDFCDQVKAMLTKVKREDDYVEISLASKYSYNPLHNDLDAFALAYSIAGLLNNLYGRGKEPFWQQAYTNVVKFVILLHKVVDGYVTLFQVYECVINPKKLSDKIAEGEQMFAGIAAEMAPPAYIVIDPLLYIRHDVLADLQWETIDKGMRTPYTKDMESLLEK